MAPETEPATVDRGRFITLEGGEGAGKSTQVTRLAAALRAAGRDVVETREPGGCPGAEQIRELLIHGAPGRWDPVTETLLHFAARRQHWREVIEPALVEGRWVISDRFADSTLAYQSYGQGVAPDDVARLYEITIGARQPDLTLILDLPVATGLARAKARGGGARYETMDADFHHRLRNGFLAIAEADPARCLVIDADREIDAVAEAVLAGVHARLGR